MIKNLYHAVVHDTIIDIKAITSGAQDTTVYQALKLIADGLGLHSQDLGQVGDVHLPGAYQGMKQSETSVVSQNFEYSRQFRSLFRGQEWALLQRRLGKARFQNRTWLL